MEPNAKARHDVQLLVVDLDGTLLHGADTFEGRYLDQTAIDAMTRAHEAGMKLAVSTARPVSTGLRIVQRLPVDACVYLNGALIDFHPLESSYESLTRDDVSEDPALVKIGFDAGRACEVCRLFTERIPGLKCGIVMNDVRYTNFDVSIYWKTQTWRYTDFSAGAGRTEQGVPAGVADKIIIFPERDQWDALGALVPDDFAVSVSEGVMWMLMNPLANKAHSLKLVCERLGVPAERTAAFGDDLIDIDMMKTAGLGVAVANANPAVLAVADEVCPANDEDGVARWIDARLGRAR
ncbi:HAD family hydrolase [Bifidobacterium avesanii]|uniref:HAD hydrolase family protein n=1 Tax=Bifidobacterium avesanii TaxID=1798157 RepID=A0A7K3TE95_9BIFI|nr:HAD family hydrolase [Bifidobacterium avesanii]KAB8295405.1 haloacid dehalogenase [Bifidobacterium avesanii]NEG77411.1 HAD hydrolase family protein [Bifidobacterium avesanii]